MTKTAVNLREQETTTMSIREIDLSQFDEFTRQPIEAGRGDVSLSSLAERLAATWNDFNPGGLACLPMLK
jgi:hypothetical protein